MSKNEAAAGGYCGCWILFFALNLAVGHWSVTYCLWFSLNAKAPEWVAWAAGLLLGQFTIPLAIIFWVLEKAGVAHPLFHLATS